jgi:hypothetical protein
MRARRLFATLCIAILLSGCFADDASPEEKQDATYSAEFQPLISDDGTTPVTANIRALDIDDDGSLEIVFTEPIAGRLGWIGAECISTDCTPTMVENIGAPVRTSSADLDGNGIVELIVADIGILYPSNEKGGRVLSIEDGEVTVLIEGLGRTVCAEPADLDGDGDFDLTLCEFGHDEGSISWLEQNDSGGWEQHILDARPGGIHAMPYDMDGDGDMDIVASISQDAEDIMYYRNEGGGQFHSIILYDASETWFGMSGLRLVDLDVDGDMDIVFTNGDTMDFDTPEGIDPNQLHGVAWLENDGTANFNHHDLVRNWGAYDTVMLDWESDGDLDMLVICLQMDGQFSANTTSIQFILLLNGEDGWEVNPVQTSANHRLLSATVIDGIVITGSHDPLGQGGDLARLGSLVLDLSLP